MESDKIQRAVAILSINRQILDKHNQMEIRMKWLQQVFVHLIIIRHCLRLNGKNIREKKTREIYSIWFRSEISLEIIYILKPHQQHEAIG